MAAEFVMPKLGLTMESGTIVNWLVDEGADVQPGQPVLIIETDKVESEVEATGAGRLHRLGEIGQEYACGAHIGWLLGAGEDVPAGRPAPAAPAADAAPSSGPSTGLAATTPAVSTKAAAATGVGGRLLASPNAKRIAAERGIDLRALTGSGPGGRITSEDVPAQAPTPTSSPAVVAGVPGAGVGTAAGGGRALATAAARNLAELLGVDLAEVAPTGVDPRRTRDDVAAHVRGLLASLDGAPSTSVGSGSGGRGLPAALQQPTSVVPMTGMRGTIADRMGRSLHSMAQLTLHMDVDMDAVVADRSSRRAAADGPVPGYTDYVIAAAAAALVEHSVVNSQIIDDGVAMLPTVNIGMAVALDGGLIVPVIPDTPSLDLAELAVETSRLAAAARDGKLTLPELEGGTFSVTALGMFDVDGFTPIINAPNTAILGVGRLRDDVAFAEDDRPVRTSRLTLSLTWDHRAFDGAPAAEFTRRVKANLESVGRP